MRLPSGTEMHLGVYGITESDHVEIQRRRKDFIALVMYLTERKLFFSVNHVFSGLTGRREQEDFNWFASYVPAFEVRNGQMWAEANASAERLARAAAEGRAGRKRRAHAQRSRPDIYARCRESRTVDEFFAGLRAGRGIVHGVHGSFRETDGGRLSDLPEHSSRRNRWALPILPLTVLVPAITAGHWLNEMRFCRKWTAALETERSVRECCGSWIRAWKANWAG